MTIAQKRTNKEIMEILKKLNLIDSIPKNVLDNIKSNQDENWEYTYDDTLSLEEQKIGRQTAIMFSSLYIMYICDEESERENLKQIYIKNKEESKKHTNNSVDVFEERINKKIEEKQVAGNSQLPAIQEKKDSIWIKIKNKLKNILKK